MKYPVTPDGRYFVVRGRLWRCSNPALADAEREGLTKALMRARSEVGTALRARDKVAEGRARARVNRAKIALGERGPVWWTDGTEDHNRRMARESPYAAWYAGVAARGEDVAGAGPGGGDEGGPSRAPKRRRKA